MKNQNTCLSNSKTNISISLQVALAKENNGNGQIYQKQTNLKKKKTSLSLFTQAQSGRVFVLKVSFSSLLHGIQLYKRYASAAKEIAELSSLLSTFCFRAGQFDLKYLKVILNSDWKLSILSCYLFTRISQIAFHTALPILILSLAELIFNHPMQAVTAQE